MQVVTNLRSFAVVETFELEMFSPNLSKIYKYSVPLFFNAALYSKFTDGTTLKTSCSFWKTSKLAVKDEKKYISPFLVGRFQF